MSNETTFIVDDEGVPVCAVDVNALETAAARLAFDMANTAATDPARMDDVTTRTLDQYGPEAFGYIAAGALKVLASDVLAPCLEVTKALGVDLAPGLAKAAAAINQQGQ